MEQLAGFEAFSFSHEGECRTVYRRGTGPAVIVMPEVPGLSAEVLRFANYIADAGFTVFLPHLFGVPRNPNKQTSPPVTSWMTKRITM